MGTEMPRDTFKAPLRPGYWRIVTRDDEPTVKLACPLCGAEGVLEEGSHTIDHDGIVSPSVVCPNESGCGWHDHIRLLDYAGPD